MILESPVRGKRARRVRRGLVRKRSSNVTFAGRLPYYKNSGWRLEPDGRHITFTDGCGIGRLKLIGTRDIETFPTKQIKRVRLVRRADGYYCQFAVQAERVTPHTPTGKQLGIDGGLKRYYTDSDGNSVENPRYYRKAEKRLKRLHRQLSRKQKGSCNRKKARKRLAKASLTVQRQREDFARKTANALVTSRDLIAFEDLKIRNLVKNKHLAKSLHDAGWGKFLIWVKAYGAMHGIPVIAVAPHVTSQMCSRCGTKVKKSLSVRTHLCPSCVTPVKGHHLSGEQSPTSSGNGSMPNVSLALEREVKDQSMTPRQGERRFQQTRVSLRAISTW